MSLNINNFKNQLTKGGVRPFLFRVQGNIGPTTLAEPVGYLCKAASLPASSMTSIPVPYRGRTLKLPGTREYAEWSLTFLSDGDFKLRNAFEKWMEDLNKTVANVSQTEHDFNAKHFPDWKIDHLDRKGKPIKSYKFFHCWPSEVAAIEVSVEDTDALAEFTVTMQYSYFTSSDVSDENPGKGIAPVPGIGS